jgi:class 3 adenylate cyclase
MVNWFVRVMEKPTSSRTAVVGSLVVLANLITYLMVRGLAGAGSVALAGLDAFLLAWTVAGILIVLAILPMARRGLEARWTAYMGVAVHGAFIVWLCHLLGSISNPIITLFPLAAILVILVLDHGAGWFGFAWMTGLLVAVGVLELRGVLPYAPLITQRSLDAVVSPSLYAAYLLVVLSIFGFCFGFAHLSAAARRVQARRLKEANIELNRSRDLLARGNELIRHYVPTQFAERLLTDAGDADRSVERRRLTLVFSDIEGFSTTADLVEPEDLSEVLNEYLAEMVAIGEQYGGTIDKFVGDAVVVFFGAPETTTDQDAALRAVRMALGMQDRLETLRERWRTRGFERPFHVRIGINTGQASVGSFGSPGRMDYTAIGRQVNLAARLQTQCERDSVLLSHTTWLLVRDEIPCTPRGELFVKGFRDPVRVYVAERAAPLDRPHA